jgi:hypothetical protein
MLADDSVKDFLRKTWCLCRDAKPPSRDNSFGESTGTAVRFWIGISTTEEIFIVGCTKFQSGRNCGCTRVIAGNWNMAIHEFYEEVQRSKRINIILRAWHNQNVIYNYCKKSEIE